MKETDCAQCNFCMYDEAINMNICTINGECEEGE